MATAISSSSSALSELGGSLSASSATYRLGEIKDSPHLCFYVYSDDDDDVEEDYYENDEEECKFRCKCECGRRDGVSADRIYKLSVNTNTNIHSNIVVSVFCRLVLGKGGCYCCVRDGDGFLDSSAYLQLTAAEQIALPPDIGRHSMKRAKSISITSTVASALGIFFLENDDDCGDESTSPSATVFITATRCGPNVPLDIRPCSTISMSKVVGFSYPPPHIEDKMIKEFIESSPYVLPNTVIYLKYLKETKKKMQESVAFHYSSWCPISDQHDNEEDLPSDQSITLSAPFVVNIESKNNESSSNLNKRPHETIDFGSSRCAATNNILYKVDGCSSSVRLHSDRMYRRCMVSTAARNFRRRSMLNKFISNIGFQLNKCVLERLKSMLFVSLKIANDLIESSGANSSSSILNSSSSSSNVINSSINNSFSNSNNNSSISRSVSNLTSSNYVQCNTLLLEHCNESTDVIMALRISALHLGMKLCTVTARDIAVAFPDGASTLGDDQRFSFPDFDLEPDNRSFDDGLYQQHSINHPQISPLAAIDHFPCVIAITEMDDYLDYLTCVGGGGGDDDFKIAAISSITKKLSMFISMVVNRCHEASGGGFSSNTEQQIWTNGALEDRLFVIVMTTKSIDKLSLPLKSLFSSRLVLSAPEDVDNYISSYCADVLNRNRKNDGAIDKSNNNSDSNSNKKKEKVKEIVTKESNLCNQVGELIISACGRKDSAFVTRQFISELHLNQLKNEVISSSISSSSAAVDRLEEKEEKKGVILVSSPPVTAGWRFGIPCDISDRHQAKQTLLSVRWEDIGGLEKVRKEIMDVFYLPKLYPEYFPDFLPRRRGVLLFGPPGSGKTMIAKAVATECNMNFVSIKGPELLDGYVGESERNIREIFQNAKKLAPCVLFFDELDSLAPARGRGGDQAGGVMDRVVSQFVTELDSLSSGSINDASSGSGKKYNGKSIQNKDVYIMGATNRPDLLDPALLRYGRFDTKIFLSVCGDALSRHQIILTQTRKLNLSSDVDLMALATSLPKNVTGADISGITSNAYFNALRRKLVALKDDALCSHAAAIKAAAAASAITKTTSQRKNCSSYSISSRGGEGLGENDNESLASSLEADAEMKNHPNSFMFKDKEEVFIVSSYVNSLPDESVCIDVSRRDFLDAVSSMSLSVTDEEMARYTLLGAVYET